MHTPKPLPIATLLLSSYSSETNQMAGTQSEKKKENRYLFYVLGGGGGGGRAVLPMAKKRVLILAIALMILLSVRFTSFEANTTPAIGSTTVTLNPIADSYVNSSNQTQTLAV